MNDLMKVSAAVLASVGNLISNGGRFERKMYWDTKIDLEKFVLIHEDHFNEMANLWDDYQIIKAKDKERQREITQQDHNDTILSFAGDVESAIRRGAKRGT